MSFSSSPNSSGLLSGSLIKNKNILFLSAELIAKIGLFFHAHVNLLTNKLEKLFISCFGINDMAKLPQFA